jgi:hypothetical protein
MVGQFEGNLPTSETRLWKPQISQLYYFNVITGNRREYVFIFEQ